MDQNTAGFHFGKSCFPREIFFFTVGPRPVYCATSAVGRVVCTDESKLQLATKTHKMSDAQNECARVRVCSGAAIDGRHTPPLGRKQLKVKTGDYQHVELLTISSVCLITSRNIFGELCMFLHTMQFQIIFQIFQILDFLDSRLSEFQIFWILDFLDSRFSGFQIFQSLAFVRFQIFQI